MGRVPRRARPALRLMQLSPGAETARIDLDDNYLPSIERDRSAHRRGNRWAVNAVDRWDAHGSNAPTAQKCDALDAGWKK